MVIGWSWLCEDVRRTGPSRMWLLSVACDTFLAARPAGPVQPLSAAEIASWRAVQDELLPRLWLNLRRRAGEPGDPG